MSAADDIITGTGTDEDPYIIDSVNDLRSIGTEGYGMDGSYLQTNDILFAWNDDLNNDNALTLKANIIETVVGDVLEVKVLMNNSPITLDPETDYLAVSVNGKASSIPDKQTVLGPKEAVIRFPADLFVPDDENVVSVCGIVSSVPFGTAAVFGDVPFKMSEYIGGNFTPIGTPDRPFSGSYDGGGHSITGMRVFAAANDPSAGMFGHTEGARISDLTLASGERERSYIIASSVHGTPVDTSFNSAAGSFIGSMKATSVTSVQNQGCIVVSSNAETLFVSRGADGFAFVPNGAMTSSSGGIVGEGDGTIKDSVNNGHAVSLSGRIRSIHLDGDADEDATFDAGSDSRTFTNAGGIIGSGSSVSISNSSSEGSVFAASDCGTYLGCTAQHISDPSYSDYNESSSAYSGGIIGSVTSMNIVNVSSSGRVHAVRQVESILSCRNYAFIDDAVPPGKTGVGGIVGNVVEEIIMKNCVASGDMVFRDAYSQNTADLAAGGLIGASYAHVTKISSSCATNTLYGEGRGAVGGIIGIGSLSGMDQTYYLSGSPMAPSGTDAVTENRYAKIGTSTPSDLGNKWDFDRVWTFDPDNKPAINLRFSVDFVSEHDDRFSIHSKSKTDPSDRLVNGTSSGFAIALNNETSRSRIGLHYENGDAIAVNGGDFVVNAMLDENGSPMDRTITVSGIELNRYSVGMPSLPEGVVMSMSDTAVAHGSGTDVAFSSDTHDLSRLRLVSTGNCDIADSGGGLYHVYNITGDIELFLVGPEAIGDLTDVSNLLYVAAALISVGVLCCAIKLIRLKWIT